MATTYNIGINYNVTGNATVGLRGIASEANRATLGVNSLNSAIGKLATVFTITKLFEAGKKAFIDWNSAMEQSTIAVQGVISSTFSETFEKAGTQVENVKNQLLAFSQLAPGGFQDYVEGFVQIGAAAANTNMRLSELVKFSENITAASRSGLFKGQETTLVNEVRAALSGGIIRHTGPMLTFLNMIGVSVDKFRHMNEEQRKVAIELGLQSASFQGMLKAQSLTFDAQMESLKSNVSIALGSVGKPLFAAITKELITWNDWLLKNQETIKDMGKNLTDGLVYGFGKLKDAVGFIIEHKTIFETLAALFAAQKIAGGLNSVVGGVAGGLSNMFGFGGKAGGALGSIIKEPIPVYIVAGPGGSAVTNGLFSAGAGAFGGTGKEIFNALSLKNALMGGLLGSLMPDANSWTTGAHAILGALGGVPGIVGIASQVVQALSLGTEWGLSALSKANNDVAEKEGMLKWYTDMAMKPQMNANESALLFTTLKNAGAITPGMGPAEKGKLAPWELNADKFDAWAKSIGINTMLQPLENVLWLAAQKVVEGRKAGTAPEDPLTKKSPNINVNVKMDVATDDPDRFALQFIRAVDDIVRKPVQSRNKDKHY